MFIYKIFRAAEWAAFVARGETTGSPDDLRDGFIHFSTGQQLAETAEKHFRGEQGLVLAVVDSDDLGPELRWERSRGGRLFPHLYRPLRMEEVIFHKALPLGPDGRHVFPEGVL